MGEKNLPTNTCHRLTTRALMALSALISTAVFADEITIKSLNNNDISARSSIDMSLPAVRFDERWSGLTADFSVEPDGIMRAITPAEQPPVESGNSTGEPNNIGAYLRKGNTAEGNSDTESKPTNPLKKDMQFGSYSENKKGDLGIPDCGPSPLKEAEIKALILSAAKRYDVDASFATAIGWAESAFDRHRNSGKGARGPMQLIPETAERFGVTDICDPAQNIDGGVRYLRVLLEEFRNPLLAAAAYNSGAQRIYEHGGIPPFRETVSYVAKVVNYQLGLSMPSLASKAKAKAKASQLADDETGVIAVEKSGSFVGGVMHF